jgi:hypothetical protein
MKIRKSLKAQQDIPESKSPVEQESPLPSRERARPVLSEVEGARARTWLIIAVATLLTLPANFIAAASLDESLTKRKAEATVDLATKEGVQLVKGEWRYSDTKIVEFDF